MKKSIKDCLLVAILAVLVGIVIFLLFNSGILASNVNLFLFLLISIPVSIYVLVKLLKIKKIDNIADSYCYCGHLSAIGAAGVLVTAFILSLFAAVTGVLFYVFAALFFLFLVFMVGGLVCLLYTMNDCHNNNCNDSCRHKERINEDNNEDYGRNQYNRNSDYGYKERRR